MAMRTHLLRTFYPSPAAEPDTGCAANDEEYGHTDGDTPRATASVSVLARPLVLSSDDEYQLGGYAGI
jgi:hypothetical protein